jgi:hypothetical protein
MKGTNTHLFFRPTCPHQASLTDTSPAAPPSYPFADVGPTYYPRYVYQYHHHHPPTTPTSSCIQPPQTMPSLASLLRLATQGALALVPSPAPQHTTTTAAITTGTLNIPAILPAPTTNTVITTPSLRGLGPQKTLRAADGPIDLGTGNLTWTGTHKEIRVNGQPYLLKGLSWFGLEVRLQRHSKP